MLVEMLFICEDWTDEVLLEIPDETWDVGGDVRHKAIQAEIDKLPVNQKS